MGVIAIATFAHIPSWELTLRANAQTAKGNHNFLAELIDPKAAKMVEVTVLDYGAGNVRSVKNAIRAAGHTVKDVASVEDIGA
ncbi:hypothetical protein BBJ28_00024224, partial [Nothophytophthora sp. Chile5]